MFHWWIMSVEKGEIFKANILTLTRNMVCLRKFVQVCSFFRRQCNHLDTDHSAFQSLYRDRSHLIFRE